VFVMLVFVWKRQNGTPPFYVKTQTHVCLFSSVIWSCTK
jgi:hypothetical protein